MRALAHASRHARRSALVATFALACGGCERRADVRVAGPVAPAASAGPPAGALDGGPPRTSAPPLLGELAARWDPLTGSVHVEARFAAGAGAAFGVERGAEPFARDVEASSADSEAWSPVTRRGRQFDVAPCAAGPCRLRYRYALREAAQKLDDLDTASEEGAVVEAPPSTWLLSPTGAGVERRLRFRVSTPEGARFVTGVVPSTEAADAWDIRIDDLWTSPYSAFGPLRVRAVPVAGGTVQLAIGPGQLAVTDDELARWVEQGARAVSAYYAGFPMPGALVLLAVARGPWVGSGRTLAGGGGSVFVRIGEKAKASAYAADWVLVHELIHLTIPSLPRAQDWAEEGLATYAEPFARVRAGLLDEEAAWGGLAEGLPNGLPRPGDHGLDHTHTWGRTYWGGALFWFLADVEIRTRTHNRLGLEHALRAVNQAGGTNAVRWPISDVLAAGDRATGAPVLTELYAAMKASPHPVDLPALMKALGVVEVSNGRAKLDDAAPLAAIRRAISRGSDAPGRAARTTYWHPLMPAIQPSTSVVP